MTRTTSRDVARRAGVSQTTVSFVMNGRNLDSISPATREAVLSAARELRFVPSSAARALRLGRNDVILCLVPDYAASEMMERFKLALSAEFSKAGLACVFFHYTMLSEPMEDILRRFNPAFVVSCKSLDQKQVALLEDAAIPILDGIFSDATIIGSEAWIDQQHIGRLQVDHLVGRGRTRLAFVGIDDDRERDFCEPRRIGAIRACRENGLADPRIVSQSGYGVEDALATLTILQEDLSGSVGIAAYNDLVAASLMAAARERKIEVPERLAIVGVDDTPFGGLLSPGLTTIRLNLNVSAGTICKLVLARLELPAFDVAHGDHEASRMPLELIQRFST